MKKSGLLRTIALVILLLGALAPQFAQNVPQGPTKPDGTNDGNAFGLVRTINTAEVGERSTYGSYAPWETLLEHEREFMNEWQKMIGVQLGPSPEVLPGWNLRLNVRGDGQAYDLILEHVSNKQNPLAIYTNEIGVIWKAAPLQ